MYVRVEFFLALMLIFFFLCVLRTRWLWVCLRLCASVPFGRVCLCLLFLYFWERAFGLKPPLNRYPLIHLAYLRCVLFQVSSEADRLRADRVRLDASIAAEEVAMTTADDTEVKENKCY